MASREQLNELINMQIDMIVNCTNKQFVHGTMAGDLRLASSVHTVEYLLAPMHAALSSGCENEQPSLFTIRWVTVIRKIPPYSCSCNA